MAMHRESTDGINYERGECDVRDASGRRRGGRDNPPDPRLHPRARASQVRTRQRAKKGGPGFNYHRGISIRVGSRI